ncbi:Amino acid permease [Candidatus Hydrogenisulfobacillus filiaventi]|uniref:Amino acid permease n=1 Tax=Candidatus Hydrogenisulfobacillus filiaventi TaxID=2707344 RepID=A0A6F8ZJV7_9FIRM|nr:amino acid permease [Bacillota bacterium]CAB1129733.1 Amino acid permease [Candidatus Hydrogenisulfobacillus filiaventi]
MSSHVKRPIRTRMYSRAFGSGHPPASRAVRKIGQTGLTLTLIGGIMGSGLFLASGQAIRLAGPAIALSYLLGVTIMAIEVAALAEMSAADPVRGSFLAYARRTLGPGLAFVGGWVFWFSSILNIAAEGTAGALFTRLWFPAVPVWIFSVGYALLVVGINFLTVKGFAGVESGMSLTKVMATAVFVVAGLAAAAGLLPAPSRRGWALWTASPAFLPRGLAGVAGAMVLVMFSMSGTGVLGLAAPNVKKPEGTIAATIRNTVIAIYVLYVGSALAITGILPWHRVPIAESPFTAALRVLPWGWAASLFNLVILLAVLSAMNAGLFATDRVLATLGRIHDAPAVVARESHGIPRVANAVTGVLLVLVSGLAYFLPKTAYLYLVTATGFQALFVWILIMVTQIYYRPRLLRQGVHVEFRVPGYPWLSWVGVVLMVGVIATAPLAPHELIALGIGAGATVLFALAYLPVRRARAHSSP